MVVGLIIIFGLIFGSFLNVVIARLPEKQSLSKPRSRCPSCQTPIRYYDNVPLLSYIILKGKCRHCQTKIPIQYPFVELLTAVLLVLLYLKFGLSVQFLTVAVLTLFLIPISIIDFKVKLILNKLTIAGFIFGILLLLGFQIENWKDALFGALGGGAVAWSIGMLGKVAFRKESMGMGDVKLLVMIGVYVGFPESVYCLFFGALTAAVFIVGGMIIKKIRMGDIIPFGPFIAIGTLVFLVWGRQIVDWYISLL